MRGSKSMMLLLSLVLVAVGPAVGLAASQNAGGWGHIAMLDYGSVQGKVTAVNPMAETLTVMPTDGSMAGPVQLAMNEGTRIHDGLLNRPAADLKPGEDVNVRYSGPENKLVADSINILDPTVPIAHYAGPGVK